MYYASAKFLQLDPATQRLRRGVLEQIRTRPAGRKPYKLMEPRHVAELRDEKVDAPTQANKIVMYLRYVFDWAMKEEVALATRNPTTNVEMLETKPGGIHAWTVDEVEAFEARHPIGTKARLAFALLLYLGVRRSDVIRLGRQQLRTVRNADGEAEQWITFDVFKGRKRNPKSLTLPILPELQAIIDATPSTNMTFLVTEQGKPFTNGYFGNWFKGRCREAGLGKCSAHGLRKAGASFAAEGGATERQLMALYGWDSKNEPERYTRSARQKELAGDGMPSLTRGRNKNKSVPPSATVSAGGTFRRKKP
jgi:integrase